MCVSIYLAGDQPWPDIPRDEAHPAFHTLEAVVYPEEPFRAHFTRSHLISVGCHHGCGCGFQSSEEYDQDGNLVETDLDAFETRRRLAEYLSIALQSQPLVEVLVCCSGDETFPVKTRRRATPNDFASDPTIYNLGQRIDVVADSPL